MLQLLIESNSSEVFNLRKPGNYVEEYMDWYKVGNVSGHDYKKYEKCQDGNIVYMTCDEYINNCIYKLFKSTRESVVDHAVDFDRVSQYAKAMKSGSTFPVPYINYATRQQEGRHRAFAFAEAFGPDAKFPVVEIVPVYPEDVTNDELYEYAKRKMGGKEPNYILDYIMSIHDRSDKEICEYKGIPYEEPEIEIPEQDLDDAIYDEVDIDMEYERLSQLSGKSIKEIENLDAIQFAKLVDKYL